MACPDFTVAATPPALTPSFGGEVTLTKTTSIEGFGPGQPPPAGVDPPAGASVSVICGDGSRHPVQDITLWSDLAVQVTLPPEPPGCAAPQIEIVIPRPVGGPDVCTAPLGIPPPDLAGQIQQRLDLDAEKIRIEADITPVGGAAVPVGPDDVAPLGPGDSLGLGLASLPSSVPVDLPTGEVPVPVTAAVEWAVVGGPFPNQPLRPLQAGEDFLASDDLTSLALSLTFRPRVAEESSQPPPALRRRVRVTVTLTARPSEAGVPALDGIEDKRATVTLQLEVAVSALLVPAVLALFRHRHFAPRAPARDGYILLVVPATATNTDVAALTERLGEVRDRTGPLRPLFPDGAAGLKLVPFFRSLELLLNKLKEHRDQGLAVRVRKAPIEDLSNVSMTPSRRNANESTSSLIFVGINGRKAECFNAKGFGTRRGQLNVIVEGELAAVIEVLGSRRPTASPGRADPVHGPLVTFGNAFSSLRLG